jgi:hypothetical protein
MTKIRQLRGISAARQTDTNSKPVYLCWMAERDLDRAFTVDGAVIPTYRHPEVPGRTISRAIAYETHRMTALTLLWGCGLFV